MSLLAFIGGALSTLLLLDVLARRRSGTDLWSLLGGSYGGARPRAGQPVGDVAYGDAPDQGTEPTLEASDPLALAENVAEYFESAARPQDLLSTEPFVHAAATLAAGPLTTRDLLSFGTGANVIAACLALDAIARRDDDEDPTDGLLATLDAAFFGWRDYFALHALQERARTPVSGRLLVRLHEHWTNPVSREWLAEFFAARQQAGEVPTFANAIAELDALPGERRAELDQLIEALADVLPHELRQEYADWRKRRTNVFLLRSIGQVHDRGTTDSDRIIEHAALTHATDAAEHALRREPARPVVISGEPGVGKSTAIACLANRLRDTGWLIFEASAAELLAGQTYVGQIEGRVQSLVRELEHRNVLWIVPDFHELLYSGRSLQNPSGTLDLLFPYLERGAIRLVGETQPLALEKVLQQRPRLRGVVETVRIEPLPADATFDLTSRWAAAHGIDEAILRDAHQLATQHLGEQASPGHIFELLKLTAERVQTRDRESGRSDERTGEDDAAHGSEGGRSGNAAHGSVITRDDLLSTLGALTGLPREVLDEHASLDVQALRRFFAARVLGQDEAIDALVERVALIKAGLTDPTRPQGVFLFAGPTGTGKTELAKALADYLFGSPDRMIRLDMSEFQDVTTLPRLLGSRGDVDVGTSIIDDVRRQPFSVVLIDELEKADPRVWDLFLQLFDDGRLTDMNGSTASFRSTIVIMTSNIGGGEHSGAAIGFSSRTDVGAGSGAGSGGSQSGGDSQSGGGSRSGGVGFGGSGVRLGGGEAGGLTPASMQRLLEQTFRPEFINRIDRIVPFRPLPRSVMRELLDKEIREVLGRRGLRNRAWALEWEESAIELLIRHGFSPSLGARPLKRAVERYLLSPLAMSIVGREVPEGDQFLFIGTAGDRLTVEFVDPDAGDAGDDAGPLDAASGDDAATSPALEDIVRDARGEALEVEALGAEYAHLRTLIDSDAWQQRKHAALAETASAEFWASPRRHEVLGLAEYMDRVEVGLETAGSLLRRLNGGGRGDGGRFPRELVRRLAQQLYLVGEAVDGIGTGAPRDAFIEIRAVHEPGGDAALANAFAARIALMYRRWAEKRRMRMQILDETGDDAVPYSLLLAVSGFAAYSILAPEHGEHVLESPLQAKAFLRARAVVHVAAQPDEPPSGSITLLAQARRAIEPAAGRATIVRRYREEPSPLVRDTVRGWRTGRLDQVLAGDFDLMG